MAFGSLWLPYDRRGDLAALFESHRLASGAVGEVKWTKVKRGGQLKMALRLVDSFFERNRLSFHAYTLEQSVIDLEHHKRDRDLAHRKHFTQFLSNKMIRIIQKRGLATQFHVWVDPIASRYDKADEALQTVSTNIIQKLYRYGRPGHEPVQVRTQDSKERAAIQICDVLLGAITASYNGKVRDSSPKSEVCTRIAEHLGWPDLRADTKPYERKFNIWNFHDPARDVVRRIETREVQRR